MEEFLEKYGIGFSYYSVSIRYSEGCSHATRWFRLFYFPLFPLGRYKVKFYFVNWGFNYVDVDVLSPVKSKWYLNLFLYLKVFIFGTALYMAAVLIMLYLDTLRIFKGPHVLLVLAYWILLTVLLYKWRNKKVNPPGNRRPSRLSRMGNEKNKPAISEINPEKYLQPADHCPYCAVAVIPRKGENHCPNCNITYTVTESNCISDNTRPLIDIFRTLFFVFAITCHTVFFLIFWEIDFNIVFKNNSLFLLLLPWVIHYLLFLFIAFRYGFINSPGSLKFYQHEGDIIKVRYTENRKHFLIHIILYSIAILIYLIIVFMILTGRV